MRAAGGLGERCPILRLRDIIPIHRVLQGEVGPYSSRTLHTPDAMTCQGNLNELPRLPSVSRQVGEAGGMPVPPPTPYPIWGIWSAF